MSYKVNVLLTFALVVLFQNCNFQEQGIAELANESASFSDQEEITSNEVVAQDGYIEFDQREFHEQRSIDEEPETELKMDEQKDSYPKSSSQIDPYVTKTLAKLQSHFNNYLAKLQQNEPRPYWGIADNLRTAYQLYQINKDLIVLEFILQAGERLADFLSISRNEKDVLVGKPVYAWTAGHYSCGKNYGHLVHNAILIDNIAFAMTELMRGKERELYRERIVKLLTLFEKIFEHFDGTFQQNLKGYVFDSREKSILKNCLVNDFKSRAGTLLPQNMNVAAGIAHFRMYYLNAMLNNENRKNWHKQRFASISSLLKKSWQLWKIGKRTGYSWKYKEGGRYEDSSHAFLTIRFVNLLSEKGWSFNATDRNRLAETFHVLYLDGKKVRSHLSTEYGSIAADSRYLNSLAKMSLLCHDSHVLSKVNKLVGRGFGGLYAEVALKRYTKDCPY